MEFGRGAQYKVNEISLNRVEKVPLKYEEARAVVASWYEPDPIPDDELENLAHRRQDAIASCEFVKQLLSKHVDVASLFGNPIFEGHGVYTQDKLRPLQVILKQADSVEDSRDLIDRYIESILRYWQLGFSERVFNFSVNNGVDRSGNIVLLDFGEITLKEEKAALAVTSKRWLSAYSYMHDLPDELKPYYSTAMEERLTIDRLHEIWNTA